MPKLRIYVVEDEPLYADQLIILVDELGYELLGSSDNSDTAKVEIHAMKPDLVLVDIGINGTMDGIELMASLQLEKSIPHIFISSYIDKETFERAKRGNPNAYLEKPFNEGDLQRSIELAFNAMHSEKKGTNNWEEDLVLNDTIFIKNKNRLYRLSISDILYIEVEDRYSTIYSVDGKRHVLRMGMGELQQKLQPQQFFRVHRKYTINLDRIKTIDLNEQMVYLGDVSIPISRNRKEELIQRVQWLQ